MKLELEPQDIEAVANRVAELLKPLLAGTARREEKDIIFTVVQLAEYLNVTDAWVYDRIRDNEIPHSRLGKYLRFKKRDIDKWIEMQSFKPFPDLKIINSR
jgi:excisionase family DNA binding protein